MNEVTDTRTTPTAPGNSKGPLTVAECARRLGCTRHHLLQVVKEKRHSPRLLLAYGALQAAAKAEANPATPETFSP